MKALVLIFLLFLVACGPQDQGPASTNYENLTCETLPFVGAYSDLDHPGHGLEIFDDCSAFTTYCGYAIQHTFPTNENFVELQVFETVYPERDGCAPAPHVFACFFDLNGLNLDIDCGANGIRHFQRSL